MDNGFKMKGSSLYGKLNLNKGGYAKSADGRPKSSPFQDNDKDKPKVASDTTKHNYATYGDKLYDVDGRAVSGDTVDFGETGEILKNQNGRRYIEQNGKEKVLFLDPK